MSFADALLTEDLEPLRTRLLRQGKRKTPSPPTSLPLPLRLRSNIIDPVRIFCGW